MAKSSLPKRPRLNASQQSAMIKATYPNFELVQRGKKYIWRGVVQPTPLSECYHIRITYKQGWRPEVGVISPELIPIEKGGKIKHVFPKNQLCLHLPGEWSSYDYIAQTVIPWVSLWLFHYEIWHATGEWLGGGHEPNDESVKKASKKSSLN